MDVELTDPSTLAGLLGEIELFRHPGQDPVRIPYGDVRVVQPDCHIERTSASAKGPAAKSSNTHSSACTCDTRQAPTSAQLPSATLEDQPCPREDSPIIRIERDNLQVRARVHARVTPAPLAQLSRRLVPDPFVPVPRREVKDPVRGVCGGGGRAREGVHGGDVAVAESERAG